MSQLEKLQEINEKTTLPTAINNVVFWVQCILQQSLQKYKNLFRDDANKILNCINTERLYSSDRLLEDYMEKNLDEIEYVSMVTEKWMMHHYLSHIFLYCFKMSGIFLRGGKIYFDNKNILNNSDTYWFEYDLYLSYVSGIQFDHYIFNIDFVNNNQHILWKYFSQFTQNNNSDEKIELLKIFNKNLDIFLWKNRDKEQQKMIELFRLADLLWVIDGCFGRDFFIDASFIEILYWNETSIYAKKPFFVQEIIVEIFWENKTIKITEENYWEMKQKFQDIREKYLKDIWVEDIDNQKEIAQKLQQKYEQ